LGMDFYWVLMWSCSFIVLWGWNWSQEPKNCRFCPAPRVFVLGSCSNLVREVHWAVLIGSLFMFL
jgi:hypothetical protein